MANYNPTSILRTPFETVEDAIAEIGGDACVNAINRWLKSYDYHRNRNAQDKAKAQEAVRTLSAIEQLAKALNVTVAEALQYAAEAKKQTASRIVLK